MLKSSDQKKYDTIQTMDPPILKIVLKLDQLIPKFHFIFKINSKNRGP